VVRCPGCGEAVSEWAARCPLCRAVLDNAKEIVGPPRPAAVAASPNPNGATGAGGPTEITKGRPDSHRSLPILLAALAAVIIGTVLAVSPWSSRSSLSNDAVAQALDAYTAVYAGSDGVTVVPLNGRASHHDAGAASGTPLDTAEGIVFIRSGWAYLLPPPFTGSPRALTRADRLFPMIWPGEVGVSRRLDGGQQIVEFVDLEGGPHADLQVGRLSDGFQPVAQFLAEGPGGTLRTWVPGSAGDLQLDQNPGRAAFIFGTSNSEVAWTSASGCSAEGECPLFLTDGTGHNNTVVPPPGHLGFLAGGALSPDGRLLASFVSVARAGHREAQLALVDTATLQVTIIPGSVIPLRDRIPAAQWTPDGQFVFFSGPTGRMHVYGPGAAASTTLDIAGSTTFAVG
jgi:hypothetical protein